MPNENQQPQRDTERHEDVASEASLLRCLEQDLRVVARVGVGDSAKLESDLQLLPTLNLVAAQAPGSAVSYRVLAIPGVVRQAIDRLETEEEREAAETYWHPTAPTSRTSLGERRKAVAEILHVTPETVRKHREPILIAAVAREILALEADFIRSGGPTRGKSGRLRPRIAIGAVAFALLVIAGAALTLIPGRSSDPAAHAPHATGITHAQYPYGYRLLGRYTPSFNNYLDRTDYQPNDERWFLGARVIRPFPRPLKGFLVREPLRVSRGDLLQFRLYVHNNAGSDGNRWGKGPGVARDTRVLVSWPTRTRAPSLDVGAVLYAENAIVDETDQRLHTIFTRFTLQSETGVPITLRFAPGQTRLLQSNRPRGLRGYQSWKFGKLAEYRLFSGRFTKVGGGSNLDPSSGVGIGSDGSFRASRAIDTAPRGSLSWYGCSDFHGYVLFRARVV